MKLIYPWSPCRRYVNDDFFIGRDLTMADFFNKSTGTPFAMFTDNSIPSRNFPEFRKFNVPKRHYAKLFTERMQNTNRKSRGLRPRKSKSKTLMYTASVVKAAWLVDGATAGATIPDDGASPSMEYWLNRPFMIKHAGLLVRTRTFPAGAVAPSLTKLSLLCHTIPFPIFHVCDRGCHSCA